MEWQKIVLIVFMTAGSLATINHIGKPRQPLTSGVAAASTLITALVIVLILSI